MKPGCRCRFGDASHGGGGLQLRSQRLHCSSGCAGGRQRCLRVGGACGADVLSHTKMNTAAYSKTSVPHKPSHCQVSRSSNMARSVPQVLHVKHMTSASSVCNSLSSGCTARCGSLQQGHGDGATSNLPASLAKLYMRHALLGKGPSCLPASHARTYRANFRANSSVLKQYSVACACSAQSGRCAFFAFARARAVSGALQRPSLEGLSGAPPAQHESPTVQNDDVYCCAPQARHKSCAK